MWTHSELLFKYLLVCCREIILITPRVYLPSWSVFRVLLYSAFCFQSIAKNRKHWSSQNLDDNVLMVRILKSSFNRLRKCVNSVQLHCILEHLSWMIWMICLYLLSFYVCVFVLQPKLTDEEGWKRFCLGEKVYLGTSSCHTDAEPEPALDYSKVVRKR